MSERCDYVFEYTNNRCVLAKGHLPAEHYWALSAERDFAALAERAAPSATVRESQVEDAFREWWDAQDTATKLRSPAEMTAYQRIHAAFYEGAKWALAAAQPAPSAAFEPNLCSNHAEAWFCARNHLPNPESDCILCAFTPKVAAAQPGEPAISDSERAEQFALIWEVPVDEVNALVAQVRSEARETALEQIDLALQAGKTRYSRDQGEPEPTPSFPVEVVFTMPQWYAVLAALASSEPAVQVEGAGE